MAWAPTKRPATRAMKADPVGIREIAMRSIAWIRNYSLVVFFLVLVGGVLLQPSL